jgi:hypothetical protein
MLLLNLAGDYAGYLVKCLVECGHGIETDLVRNLKDGFSNVMDLLQEMLTVFDPDLIDEIIKIEMQGAVDRTGRTLDRYGGSAGKVRHREIQNKKAKPFAVRSFLAEI